MKYAPSSSDFDGQLFRILLTPSWLSGIFDVCLTLVVCLGTMGLAWYQSSSLRLDYLSYQADKISSTYQRINTNLSANSFISNLPLLLFWSFVGLVVYIFVTNIFSVIHATAELNTELHYVHVNQKTMLRTATMHLLIRFAVLAVWVLYILFFIHHILPYCIAASLIGISHESLILCIGYVLLGVSVLAVALHLHTILLRLLLLRPRVFSSVLYVD
jgi:hypothetical protein